MRLKSSVWWAISIVLFIASAYFWNLGEKKRAADQVARERHRVSMPKAPAQAPLISNGPAVASKTNTQAKPSPSSFRVSNTTRPLAQLQRDGHAILLRNALIDTTKPLDDLKIPAKWRAKGEAGSYIVQLDHPLDKAFYDALKAAGAKFVSYIPNNAALITASADIVKQLPYSTQLAYEPYYKADPKIITGATATNQFFRVTGFAGTRDGVANAIAQAGGEIVGEENMVFGPSLIAKVDSSHLADIAQSTAVQAIEPAVPRAHLNDLTRATLGVAANSSNAPNYLLLTGSNIVINVNDTGVDGTHPDLTNRVAGDVPSSLIDFDGHGTHVAGIIAGDGSMSTNVTLAVGSTGQANPPPNYFSLQFHGAAPKANIFMQSIDNFFGPFITDTYLQTNAAATTNVHISNNSWGYVGADPYSMPTASYDAAVRDALPGTTGSQPILYVFAAGNEGNGADNGMNAVPDTILSPAAGKNVISVGAVESLRNITNTIVYQDGTNFVTNAVWAGMTDTDSQVASFSSRGNVGIGVEGDFGRFKPDVVAPGVFIVSTRSTNWTDPTNFFTADVHSFPDQSVAAGATNTYAIGVPSDAVEMDVVTIPNAASPNPFPALEIYADVGTNATTLRGKGQTAFSITGGNTWTVGIKDTIAHTVAYDLQIFVVRTNAFGTYFDELTKLNDGLGPFYRYESGTSMAAPAVTGVLALMEDYLENRLGLTPSPALMKALLINGARTLGNIYDFETRRISANDQGWGLVNLPNSIPSDMAVNAGPVVFFDQSVSNALATGDSRTWTVSPTDLESPMRITLVWTDPPGNPAAGVKLVNDLDLIVTNLETGEVFVGNNFQTGDVFSRSDDPAFGPITDSDTVNNVENVYLFGALGSSLGSNYTVTVRASHVNVNAVTEHPDNIVQDFALVISGGTRPAVATTPDVTAQPRLVTIASNSVALLYQRVGANTPLLSTPGTGATNGMISQWHFFIFTNDVDFTKTNATNVAFVTFLPPNLSQSRLQEPPGVAPRGSDGADIDLYVSTNAGLLDLDPNVIAAADKSTSRGGTEFVTYTNSTQGEVYYIGVKAEDQQAAEFGFFGLATDKPFGGLNANGQLEMNFSGLPAVIPDGYPALPGRPPVIAVAVVVPTSDPKATVRRLVFNENITHELLGDLYGTLTHNGTEVVINNHTSGTTITGATNFIFTYDDSSEGDITVAKGYPGHFENGFVEPPEWMHADGPGSLQDFANKPALGVWMFMIQDNALNHTGTLNSLKGWIDPNPPTNVLHQVRTISGNGWFYDFLNLPDDTTNLNIAVTYQAGTGPVDIYLRKNFFPSPTNYDAAALGISSPGGSLNVNTSNSPPITGGFWIYGIHNDSGNPVTIAIDITITRSLTPDLVQTITNKTGTVLLDDAITTSQIQITNPYTVVGVEVGLRLDHPRLSDLSIELISPQGTHVMLFEDRGHTNATALGLDATTNDTIYTIFTEDTNKASQLIKFALPPYAQVSALITNSVISSNGFDDLAEGSFTINSIIDGWTVLTNQVGVEFEPELNTSPTNYLALGSGAISQSVPTQIGKTYLLTHTYHGPNIFDWWTADGNVKDSINPTNSGTFTNLDGTQPFYTAGEVGEAWHFDGTNTEVIINTNACNFGTNDFTIEFWIQSVSASNIQRAIMEKWPGCNGNVNFWDIRMGPSAVGVAAGQIELELSGDNLQNHSFVASTNNQISDGQWHHVAFIRDEDDLSVYIDGQFENHTVSPIAYLSNNVPFHMGQSICQCCDGTLPFAGNLDEVTVYQRSLAPAEIYDIYAAGRAGKRTTVSVLPNIDYLINGATNDTLVSGVGNSQFATGPGDTWLTNTIGFTATNSSTQITIQGNPLGMLLDDLVVEELPNTNYANYFFPEESLSAFNGELASGVWTLEIHDARGGQSGKLLDWELNMTYSSTNVNLITIEPGVCTNATAPAGGYAYFAVDVPALAKFATNTLNNTGPNSLNLIFNQATLPTGFSAGDFYLMANAAAPTSVLLAKNSGPPFLEPGQRYFLAVQNQSSQDQTFCLQVDFDVNTNFTITSLDDSVNNPITTNVVPASVQYYYFDVTNNLAVFEVTNMSANVDMVIRHDLPLPDALSYDYGSFNADTNNEFIVVRTNSSPVALTQGRWYVTVLNNDTNATIAYTIVAYQTDDTVNIFGLNAPSDCEGFAAQPGPAVVDTVWAFTVTDSPQAVEFDLTGTGGGALTGNLDLLVRLNAYPTPSQFDYASFNTGTSNEKIIVTTNSTMPSLNGTWYLGVQNDETFAVDYQICAAETNNAVPFPAIVSGSASYTAGNSGAFVFSWESVAGQTYYVDMSTNLTSWNTIATIRAQSSTTTYSDANPPDASRYYRVHSSQ